MPTWSTTIWTPPQTGSCGRRPFSVVSAVSLSASLLALIAALSLPYINWIYDWSDRLGLTPLAADRVLPGLRGWATFLSAKALHLLIAVAVPAWVAHRLGLGWGWVVFSYFAGQMLASCVLVALILGTHWADVTFYLPPESASYRTRGTSMHSTPRATGNRNRRGSAIGSAA